MTHLFSFQISRRFARLQLSGVMLIALLQRTPVLRMIAAAESVWVSSSLGQVLKATAVVASMLGAVDTLAGATGLVLVPADNPAEATVGTPFSVVFAYTGGPTSADSYLISNLPPGLLVPNSFAAVNGRGLNSSMGGGITGTPTQAGDFVVTIIAYDNANLDPNGPHAFATSTFTIMVSAAEVAPSITTQPSGLIVTAGQPASFSVTATGDPAPTYQWRKGGVDINGATGSTYTIASTVSGDAGTYSVLVSNGVGSGVISNGATLTVNAAPVAPSITTQPANRTVTVGQQAGFSVEAAGTAPLTYQWRKDGQNINGAISATYTIASAVSGDAGIYSVVVTNAVNSVTSNGATLTVNAATAAPAITTHPQDQTVIAGASATFTAAAGGNPTPTYQWKKGGVNIGGATNSSYTIATVTGNDAGDYTVAATNTVSSVTSNTAHLSVIIVPSSAIITITVE